MVCSADLEQPGPKIMIFFFSSRMNSVNAWIASESWHWMKYRHNMMFGK